MVLGQKLFYRPSSYIHVKHDHLQLTSAESTPVDRRLGFFFLCTAVRPVVGEPGVSLSPGELTHV